MTQLEMPTLHVVGDIPDEVAEVFDMAAHFTEPGILTIRGREASRAYEKWLQPEKVALHAVCWFRKNKNRQLEVDAVRLTVAQLDDGFMQLSLYRSSAPAVTLNEYDHFLLDYFRRVA